MDGPKPVHISVHLCIKIILTFGAPGIKHFPGIIGFFQMRKIIPPML